MAQTDVDEVRASGAQTLFLLPEEITVIESVHGLRDRNDEKYLKGIETFAKQLEDEGQIQNVAVAEVPVDGGVEYQLIAGGRRFDAIANINAGLKAGDTPRKLRCTVFTGVDAVGMVRKALRENIERENFGPMELAHDIESVRKLLKVEKAKDWSAKVAEFMGVSRAQVTQHYKLLSLPAEVQEQVKQEGWRGEAAQALLAVKPEKVKEVAVAAGEKAKADKKKKAEAAPSPATEAPKGKGTGKKGESVTKAHVVKSAREAGALEKPKPLAKSELLDFFDSIDGPAYGHDDAPVRAFARYFVDKFAAGIGSDKTAMKKFDAMVMNANGKVYAGEGTKPVEKEKAAAAKK